MMKLLNRFFDPAEAKTADRFASRTCSLETVDGTHECPICFFRQQVREYLEPLFGYGGPIHHILRLVADDTWSAQKGREQIITLLSDGDIDLPPIISDGPRIPSGAALDAQEGKDGK